MKGFLLTFLDFSKARSSFKLYMHSDFVYIFGDICGLIWEPFQHLNTRRL